MRKILYNIAPTGSFKVKYKLVDLFNFCSEYRKLCMKSRLESRLQDNLMMKLINFYFIQPLERQTLLEELGFKILY